MALGTGPQRLIDLIESEWQVSRTGRADVPPVIEFQTGTENPDLNRGVLVLRDREDVAYDTAKHDLIHCYHPEANPPIVEDNGYKEQRVVETVQIDIELTDRTDHSRPQGQQRLSARERMVGLREDTGGSSGFTLGGPDGATLGTENGGTLGSGPDALPEYPGINGEVKYILETVRRGLAEWDKVSHNYVNMYLGNSNANASIVVELEQPAENTAPQR
jgi:hypothetical protein